MQAIEDRAQSNRCLHIMTVHVGCILIMSSYLLTAQFINHPYLLYVMSTPLHGVQAMVLLDHKNLNGVQQVGVFKRKRSSEENPDRCFYMT